MILRPIRLNSRYIVMEEKAAFADEDCKNEDSPMPLLAGWTMQERQQSKQYLVNATSTNAARLPTPYEEKVFKAVGQPLEKIMRFVLKRWHKSMKTRLDKHSLKTVKTQIQVDLIMTYLKLYQKEYESEFGLMEEQEHPQSSGQPTVHIRSIGYAAEVFLGIIMADRIWAINQQRKASCRAKGFVDVDVKLLDADERYCTICCDELGVANPEGNIEQPVRVVICCHQIFGQSCLKVWLKENWKSFDRDTCPNCRFKFPESFVEKFLGEDHKTKKDRAVEDEEGDDARDSASESEVEEQNETSESSNDTATSTGEASVVEAQASTMDAVDNHVEEPAAASSSAAPVDSAFDTPMGNSQFDSSQIETNAAEPSQRALPPSSDESNQAAVGDQDVLMHD